VNGSGEDLPARVRLAPKVIAEMNDLHARSQELASDVRRLGGRRARRELRDARQAESDLLRVLGFDGYDDFVSTTQTMTPETPPEVELPASRPYAEVVVEDSHATIDELWRRLAACEEEIAQARHAMALLRDDLKTVRNPALTDGLADARAAVFETCAELSRACEELVRERKALTEVRAVAEAAAEEIIAAAGETARQIVEEARQRAVNAVRDATVTLEGVRRLTNLPEID
jgi:hypothetical protein